jgi:DNA modification methylase
VVIDEDNRILAGNGTVDAAKRAGISKVRVIETDGDEIIAVKRTGLTEDQKIGLALADNRTSDLSEWDKEMLHQLSEEHDITPWFEAEDLAEIMGEVEVIPAEGLTDADDVPEVPEEPTTKPGDLWILGNHRLLCGDSTDIHSVERLMDGKKADMVFTDPPYGMNLDTDYTKMGTSTKSYKPVHDDDKPFDAGAMMRLLPSPVWYIWGADYFCNSIPIWEQGSTLVWAKAHSEDENKVFGSSFELCWRFPKAKKELWFVRRIHMTDEHLKAHPTQKPCELPVRAIEKDSKPGQLIVDLFGGSGTTLIACEKTSRHCRMMELDPAYCDVIVKRWEDFTGKKAILEESQEAY